MTEHLTRAGFDALAQAIQTVIHDSRIPNALRTALRVYQDERPVLNNRETGMMRAGQTESPPHPSETVRIGLCLRCNSGSSTQECRCALL